MLRLTKEEFDKFMEAFFIGMKTWARHPTYGKDLANIRTILLNIAEGDSFGIPEEVDRDYLWLILATAFTVTEFDNPPLAEFVSRILELMEVEESD